MHSSSPLFDIDEAPIHTVLASTAPVDKARLRDLLAKARELNGLNTAEIAELVRVDDSDSLAELYETAHFIKDAIYGKRLVIFAPLYVSNYCSNECTYCAFRAGNKELKRRALSQDEIAAETRILIDQGHKRVLLVAGESPSRNSFDAILESIDTIYSTRHNNGEIRRINVNIAPLTLSEFQRLKSSNIGTYQVFQETYHHATYQQVHVKGSKRDYLWRLNAPGRAMQAGIDDCGIGFLLGLADWRFELLAMMQHIDHLVAEYGVGPHTLSVPRLEPASGSLLASDPPHRVSDEEFQKLVAILRIAVPYTGIIMSTRESPELRRKTLALGVSQISAGSRTNPGGYAANELFDESQFSLGDHRPLDEVIRDVVQMGYVPSFCTGCYRLGRTGQDFMDLAKPGDIRHHCDPNAASTFVEYMTDYASPATQEAGETALTNFIDRMAPTDAERTRKMVALVRSGKRDVYC